MFLFLKGSKVVVFASDTRDSVVSADSAKSRGISCSLAAPPIAGKSLTRLCDMTISVRSETRDDIAAIHSLTEEAFRHAEHTSHTEQFITDALRNSGQLTISLVAIDQDQIVGHVAISPVALSDRTVGWYGLGPVAVSHSRRGEGIGSMLIRSALEKLRQRGAEGCVVLGNPEYYNRFGSQARSPLVLPGVPEGYFQALSFGEHTPPPTQVRYHESFDS